MQVPAVPVTPAPIIQKYAKQVKSISMKNLGVYSTNPIRLMKKGPLTNIPGIKNGEIIEDVEQIDTTLFQVNVVDEDGKTSNFTVIVPDPETTTAE